MAINYFCFIWITMLLVTASSLTVNPGGQGCSLVGLDLQNCIFTTGKSPFSIEPCCKTLNQALEAGCYCLRSLLGPSNHPVLSNELAVSFSICYISLPSLAQCHVPEQHPAVTAPPAAALPRPLPPVTIPPNNSSIVEMNSRCLSSDSANVTILEISRNLPIVIVFLCMYCMICLVSLF